MDLDSVYHYLVPDFLKAQLRDVGVMGGISATVCIPYTNLTPSSVQPNADLPQHHPLTGVPSFFMHPCSTQDAMAPFNAQLRDYLFIWLGIVGSYVGLQLPIAMA